MSIAAVNDIVFTQPPSAFPPALYRRAARLDRRALAWHEAGHVLVALHVGCAWASAQVQRRENPGVGDYLYKGQAAVDLRGMGPHQRATIGFAGAIAEGASSGEVSDEWCAVEGRVSPTDWHLIGDLSEGWQYRLFLRAADLLAANFGELRGIASRLIRHGNVRLEGRR